jgi:DNA repair exonuclease SbcCD ATPase subunit
MPVSVQLREEQKTANAELTVRLYNNVNVLREEQVSACAELTTRMDTNINTLREEIKSKDAELDKKISSNAEKTNTEINVLHEQLKKTSTELATLREQSTANNAKLISKTDAIVKDTKDQIFTTKANLEIQLVMDHIIDTVEYMAQIEEQCDNMIADSMEELQTEQDEKITQLAKKTDASVATIKSDLSAIQKRVADVDAHTTRSLQEMDEVVQQVHSTIDLHQVQIDAVPKIQESVAKLQASSNEQEKQIGHLSKSIEESVQKRIHELESAQQSSRTVLEKQLLEQKSSSEKSMAEMEKHVHEHSAQLSVHTNALEQLKTSSSKEIAELQSVVNDRHLQVEHKLHDFDNVLQQQRLEAAKESGTRIEALQSTVHQLQESVLTNQNQASEAFEKRMETYMQKNVDTVHESINRLASLSNSESAKSLNEKVENLSMRVQKIDETVQTHHQQQMHENEAAHERQMEFERIIHDHSEHIIMHTKNLADNQQAIENIKSGSEVNAKLIVMATTIENLIDNNKGKIIDIVEKHNKDNGEKVVDKLEAIRSAISEQVDVSIRQLRDDTNHHLQLTQSNAEQMLENHKAGANTELYQLQATVSQLESTIMNMQDNVTDVTTNEATRKEMFGKMNERLDRTERDINHLVSSVFEHSTPRGTD